MQVGTTKDQRLYNKPLTAVQPGGLAAGTLLQYNIIQYNIIPYVSEIRQRCSLRTPKNSALNIV